MKDKTWYLLWLYLFILTATLGFIPEPGTWLTVLLALVCGAFFVPGGVLLYRAIARGDRKGLNRILLISALSLAVTTVLLVANILAVLAPDNVLLGNILNAALTVLSAPMMCAPYYGISIFLWGCLLFAAITYRKQTKQPFYPR